MIALWHFYWPVVAVGLLAGVVAGKLFFRRAAPSGRDKLAGEREALDASRNKRRVTLAGGIAASLLAALIWHGPLGAGQRFAGRIEADARTVIQNFEMEGVNARLDRSPLRRRLILSGPSDEFQQGELARIMNELPGVSDVRWANPPTAPVMMK